MSLPFDSNRLLEQPNTFQPFEVTTEGEPLEKTKLPPQTELLIFEIEGLRRALTVKEMAYHHLAQGRLGEKPYLVSFCGVCHSGVGMTPILEGKTYHFQAGGLYNGVVILTDKETGSYWDHLTGECVYGSLVGKKLPVWGLEITTVAAAKKREQDLVVLRSRQHFFISQLMESTTWLFGKFSFLPSFFLKTMSEVDERLPKMTMGLGVVIDGEARFYAQSRIKQGVEDDWDGKLLNITIDSLDSIPKASWEDGSRPFQLFLRWYGFVLTFPECKVY